MAFANSYPTNLPNGDESPTLIDDLILATRKALQQRLNTDHYFAIASNTVDDVDHVGNHRQVTFDAPQATPTPAEDEGILYTKEVTVGAVVTSEMHFVDENSLETQITDEGDLNLTGEYDKELNLSSIENVIRANEIYCTTDEAEGPGLLNLPQDSDDTTEGNLRYNTEDDVVEFRDSDSWEALAKVVTLATFAQIKVSSYVGDDAATQAITGVGFQPEFILIAPANTDLSCHLKFAGMGAYTTSLGGDNSYSVNRIVSFDEDGFTVSKTAGTLNSSTVTYHYIALKTGLT